MSAFFLLETTGEYQVSRPVSGDEIIDQAKEILEASIRRSDGTVFTNPESVKTFLHLSLSTEQREVFCCLFLDNRHRLIKFEKLFAGTIDGCSVHPRIIVQQALRHNAASVVLAHQHPSGIPEPSRADEAITRRVKEALMLIDCRTLDHMVVGSDEIVSFAERGLI